MSSYLHPDDELPGVLAALADASDDAILTKDLSGVIRSWSPGAERLYGYSADEIIGRSVSLIVPADRETELDSVMQRIRNGERVGRFETVRHAKDGHPVDVSLMVVPIRDANGAVVGAAALARDLKSRKRVDAALRQSEMRWRAIIDSAVDGIVVIDSAGRIEAFNRGAERLFGYRALDVIGRNVNILMPSPYQEEHDGYLSEYLTTGIAKIIGIGREVTARRKDGSTFPIHLSVGEMTGGTERKFTGILHDLSDRVRIEEQLREQSALARLGEMAAVLAHEIKNPLAGIRGAIQVIGGRLPEGSRDTPIVSEILTRIDGLNRLMQDLLLFARPPMPKLAPVDVRALVTVTVDLLRGDPAHRDLQVTVEGAAPQVNGDAELLRIVFENLLVNGAQAMQGRGTIHVGLASLDDRCQVVFADSGPGIPAHVREKIFLPFFTTKSRGSGLGLPTAKRLIEAHRGEIQIACPEQGGTAVTIQLPTVRVLQDRPRANRPV